MKLICTTFGLAAMLAVGLGAQSSTTKTKTKVDVKDGKEIHVSGCLERNPGGGYMLTTTQGAITAWLAGPVIASTSPPRRSNRSRREAESWPRRAC